MNSAGVLEHMDQETFDDDETHQGRYSTPFLTLEGIIALTCSRADEETKRQAISDAVMVRRARSQLTSLVTSTMLLELSTYIEQLRVFSSGPMTTDVIETR